MHEFIVNSVLDYLILTNFHPYLIFFFDFRVLEKNRENQYSRKKVVVFEMPFSSDLLFFQAFRTVFVISRSSTLKN